MYVKMSNVIKKRLCGTNIIFEEPLITINMEPTAETDPLSIDEEVLDASFADGNISTFGIFPLLESESDTSMLSQNNKTGEPEQCENVMVKEDPDGSVYIKEEPKILNKSLNRSGREILADALNAIQFLCPKCPFRSTVKEAVKEHQSKNHGRFYQTRPRPCDKCSFIGKTVREFKLHQKQSHPKTLRYEELPSGEFKCVQCEYKSLQKQTVQAHSRIHSIDKIYSCDKCPYRSVTKTLMEVHTRRHRYKYIKKYKFKCKYCGIQERSQEALTRHLTLHGEGEMKSCSLCSYKTAFPHCLSQHARLYHGIMNKNFWEKHQQWDYVCEGDPGEGSQMLVPVRRPYTGKKRGRKPRNWKPENDEATKKKCKNNGTSDQEGDCGERSDSDEDLYVPPGQTRFESHKVGVRRSTRNRKNTSNFDYTDIVKETPSLYELSARKCSRRGKPSRNMSEEVEDVEVDQPLKRRRTFKDDACDLLQEGDSNDDNSQQLPASEINTDKLLTETQIHEADFSETSTGSGNKEVDTPNPSQLIEAGENELPIESGPLKNYETLMLNNSCSNTEDMVEDTQNPAVNYEPSQYNLLKDGQTNEGECKENSKQSKMIYNICNKQDPVKGSHDQTADTDLPQDMGFKDGQINEEDCGSLGDDSKQSNESNNSCTSTDSSSEDSTNSSHETNSEKCEVEEGMVWVECPRCHNSVESATEAGCLLCSTPSTSSQQPMPPPPLTRSHLTRPSPLLPITARRQLFKEDASGRGRKLSHCSVCSKVFAGSGKLAQHMLTHSGEKPFVCDFCQKAFSSKFKLVRHLLIHSDTREFVCTVCKRTFHRKDHLKNHSKIHSPVKRRFKCDREGCSKEYSSAMSYRKHLAVHAAQDGSLECTMCGETFSSQQDVLYHLKIHSGSRATKSQADKKYECMLCSRRFFTGKDVRRHLVVHTGNRDFVCSQCPQRFGRKDHLVRHMKKSHSGTSRKRKRTTKSVDSILEEMGGLKEEPPEESCATIPNPEEPPDDIPEGEMFDLHELDITGELSGTDSFILYTILRDGDQLSLPTFTQAFHPPPPPPSPP